MLDRMYHCDVKPVSRPRSITAACAYRTGSALIGADGTRHDYTRRRGVAHTVVCTPAGCEWAQDRSRLWKEIETSSRTNGRLASEIQVAIPHDLPPTARVALVERFAQELADRYGIAVDAAIHEPHQHQKKNANHPGGDNRNVHAHILCSHRLVTPEGLASKGVSTLAAGRDAVIAIRAAWCTAVNRALADAGHSRHQDHRSYREIGVPLTPTEKLGWRALAAERRGVRTEAGDRWRTGRQLQETEAEVIRLHRQRNAMPAAPEMRPSDPPNRRQGYKLRVLSNAYGASLPADLATSLKMVDAPGGRVLLRNGAWLKDHGDRLTQQGATSQESARLTAALASAKGWSSVALNGPPEYLHAVAAACARQGIAVTSPPAAAEIATQERARIEAERIRFSPPPPPRREQQPTSPSATLRTLAERAVSTAHDAARDRCDPLDAMRAERALAHAIAKATPADREAALQSCRHERALTNALFQAITVAEVDEGTVHRLHPNQDRYTHDRGEEYAPPQHALELPHLVPPWIDPHTKKTDTTS